MVEGLLQSLRTLHNAWTNVQVELHGQYSHERLSELHSYSVKASWTRIMLWFVITPIPVLVYNALLDLAPLAEPSAGRDANWVFWIRCLFTLVPMTLSMFSQFALLMPELGMGRYHVIFTSIVATTVCLAYNYIIAGYIRMPIPFIFIAGSPAFATTTGVIFAAFFGKKMLRDNDLRIKFNSTMTFITTQLSLTIVYPLFVFGFNSVTPTYQTIYMILAPFLKIAAKNVMSKLIGRLDDFKPAILIFVVDMFHALYISLVMQKATTASTSLFILMIDSVQLCVSIYDVYEAYAPLKTMMKKIPTNHPLREQNFLEIAVVIQDITAARRVTGVEGNIEVLTKRRLPSIFPKPQKVKVKKGSVAPAISNVAPSSSSSYNHLGQFITDKERACFLSSAKRLLFTIEFIMLTEYAEVIVPIFYSACCTL